jgi:preprotein translocase subunit SecD
MDNKSTPTSSGSETFLRIFRAILMLSILGYLSFFVYNNAVKEGASHPFKLGLDLAGGSHLVYQADTTGINEADVAELMNVLRNVIEARVNLLGTEENAVYLEHSSIVSGEQKERLVVELPGVTDVKEAVAEIGKTPLLEFKLVNQEAAAAQEELLSKNISSENPVSFEEITKTLEEAGSAYIDTGLTGRYLESAKLEFTGNQVGQMAGQPIVSIKFNEEGGKLFADITRENKEEQLAIFLDGEVISSPVIREEITGGTAQISGGFTVDEAKQLAQNLSFGALPVPIELQSTQTIDATLGAGVLEQSWKAGLVGFAIISFFMIAWYRVAGLVASVALAFYVVVSLALFMFVPVTLTAAGLAGFVLSLGMAVDANVLIFERMKEEYRAGRSSREAAIEGFRRAWSAIKDSNVTGLLSAAIMFWFGTSLIKGFALVLGLGILTSMLSAVVFTRTLLIVLPNVKRTDSGIWSYLFSAGIVKK